MKFLENGKKLTVAIDVDGTICRNGEVSWDKVDENFEELMKCELIPESVPVVKKLVEDGYQIVFYTSRKEASRDVTERWLKKHGFKYHHLEMEKFVGHVYIDDRAINGFSWDEVLEKIEIHDPSAPDVGEALFR